MDRSQPQPQMESTIPIEYRKIYSPELQHVAHSTLEPVLPSPKEYPSKYTVIPLPEDSAKYLYDAPQETLSRPSPWTRWPFLILYAILIAVLSGVIGGIAGRSIESNRHSGGESPGTAASTPLPGACPSVPNGNATENNATTTAAGVVIPYFDCERDDRKTLTSNHSKIDYKLYCDVDWTGGDGDSIRISTQSGSACIEACSTMESLKDKNNGTGCVGVLFVPQWTDPDVAMRANNNVPMNCFLKRKVSAYPLRDKNKRQDIKQVVAMCLKSSCPP
ncbi:hypothetical protein B0J11DRAFT_312193 [Dendryphion nanum]|uniref:Uncharacterized protein n=1 Tax=Dendryphion nanum TaxID=256645 RepID=A0A9P9DU10_9PLEO|nr:hypothetical protein B0J11DRAFT_312193 [Dendryphion nanum]